MFLKTDFASVFINKTLMYWLIMVVIDLDKSSQRNQKSYLNYVLHNEHSEQFCFTDDSFLPISVWVHPFCLYINQKFKNSCVMILIYCKATLNYYASVKYP